MDESPESNCPMESKDSQATEMVLRLRLLSGREVEISLHEEATMAELRRSVEKALGMPAHLTRLFREEVEMAAPFDAKVAQCGITCGCALTCVTMASEEFLPVKLEHREQPIPKRLQLQRLVGRDAMWNCYDFRDLCTGDMVTVRFIQYFDQDDLAGSLTKEIYLLQQLNHENLLKLVDFLPPTTPDFNDFCLIVEHMETDLGQVLRSKQELTEEHCQYLSYQMLRALSYLHSAHVVHQRLRPRSVLVNRNCHVKLSELWDAQAMGGEASDEDTARWYRAPELILNNDWQAMPLTGACDAWGLGCILFEMYQRKPLFHSHDYVRHIANVVKLLGHPQASDMDWVQVDRARAFIAELPVEFNGDWASCCGNAAELLTSLVVFDPRKRCSCPEALQHRYFADWTDPEDSKLDRCEAPIDWRRLSDLCSREKRRQFVSEECRRRHPDFFSDGG
ncbi:unnamed protein product [Durusdinium trenchii]|uniref:Mitogen-activated protein kinase 4a (MAP kinase 4a) (PpMPK4a) n=2 Tax=Durusdinium trenchii TaxID=1381693 RepID=A0ABP0L876_9DINO